MVPPPVIILTSAMIEIATPVVVLTAAMIEIATPVIVLPTAMIESVVSVPPAAPRIHASVVKEGAVRMVRDSLAEVDIACAAAAAACTAMAAPIAITRALPAVVPATPAPIMRARALCIGCVDCKCSAIGMGRTWHFLNVLLLMQNVIFIVSSLDSKACVNAAAASGRIHQFLLPALLC